MTTTILPPCSTALIILFVLTTTAVNGWVTNNVFGISSGSRVCVGGRMENSLPTSVCPTTPSPTSRFATSVEEDEVIEYLDDDDDDDDDYEDSGADYDPKAALEKQSEWIQKLQRLAATTSSDPSAVAQSQEIFDEMFRSYVDNDDATFYPTVEIYNLLLETHAFSKSADGGDEAERILERMEDTENDFVAKPNEDTYLCVMDAWITRKEPQKAQALLDRQEAPTTNSYNKMIQAYGIAGDLESAESTFRSLFSEGNANHKSWVQLMKARVSTSDNDDGEKLVRACFEEMEEEGFEPETDAFNVLIRSVGKATTDGPQRAEAILFEMIEQFRGGEKTVKPNSDTFRALLTAYNVKGKKLTTSAAAKVEQILQIRDGLLSQDESGSDETIFKIALGIISRCRDSKKAVRANRILGKHTGRPTPYLRYLVLKACAYTDGNSKDKLEAFKIALGVLKELREADELDSAISGMFIKSCSKLMPPGPKRDAVVKKLFEESCAEGLVNDFVLNEFGLASSEALQLEVLGGFAVDGVSVPDSWSKNAVE